MKLRKILHNIGSVGYGLVYSIPKIVRQPSLWPDSPRKSVIRRYFENCYFRFARHGICLGYNGLGLDVKGTPICDVLINSDRKTKFEFWVSKQRKDWTTVVSDKYLLHLYLKAHALPVVPIWACVFDGVCYIDDRECSLADLEAYLISRGGTFFFKATDEMCGKSACKIKVKDGALFDFATGNKWDLENHVAKNGRFIIQPVIVNHELLRKFNDSTLNTLRLNTCWNSKGYVELWDGGFVRLGQAGSIVDNFAAGGIAVGINASDGSLRKNGVNHDAKYNYRLYLEHPDSHIRFEGFRVPHYAEAIELVKKAQRLFPTIPSIGWDVCITDDGLLLLEANWDWGIEEIEMIN